MPEDTASTADQIMASEGLFRAGIASLDLVVVLDVVVALALYVFLKPVNTSLALLAAWFRLACATIFGVALLGLVLGVTLLWSMIQALVITFLEVEYTRCPHRPWLQNSMSLRRGPRLFHALA